MLVSSTSSRMLFEITLTLFSWFMRSRTRQANSYFEPPRPDARCHQVPTQDITQRSYQLLAGRSMTFHRSYRIQPSYLNLSPHMHVNFLSLHPSNRMQRSFGPRSGSTVTQWFYGGDLICTQLRKSKLVQKNHVARLLWVGAQRRTP
jgi:hypothetical protein